MKNKPFSIIILITAAIACVLAYVFLARSEDGFTLPLLVILCLPYLVLSVLAAVSPLPNGANFLYCVASVMLMALGVSALGDYASSHSDMRGMEIFMIVAVQIIGLIFPVLALLVGFVFSRTIDHCRRKTPKNVGPPQD